MYERERERERDGQLKLRQFDKLVMKAEIFHDYYFLVATKQYKVPTMAIVMATFITNFLGAAVVKATTKTLYAQH